MDLQIKTSVKMTYKIIGDFKRKIPIDELGNKMA